MKRIFLFVTLLHFIIFSGLCQEKDNKEKEEAAKLAKRAYELKDSAKYEEAIVLLEKASKLDPFEAPNFKYEIAKIYFHKLHKFGKAIKILKDLCERPDATMDHFELLGQSYENDKDYKKATETYKKALEKFPGKGRFYYGLGMTEMRQQKFNNAIAYWELGIQNEPMETLNYYALGRLFGSSPEKIWGILYGELYMNLNLDSTNEKNKEFSKIFYQIYEEAFKKGFTRAFNVNIPQTNEKIRLPFTEVYQRLMYRISDNYFKDGVNMSIAILHEIRKNFIKRWYESNAYKEFPCMIFDLQKKIMEEGHYEAYNYWLFRMGNIQEFLTWKAKNQDKWDAFVDWLVSNPLYIDKSNLFLRKTLLQ